MAADDEGRWRSLILWALAASGVLVFFAGFVTVWWHFVPVLYQGVNDITPGERLTAITNTRAALLAGLVGLGALGTFWMNSRAQRFTAQSLRLTEQSFRLAERSQEQMFRLTERGHLTDRYTKAIEQLGSDKIDERLGGIYALEQLAVDSDRDRDQATIVEVLSAFVRVHSQPLYQYKEQVLGPTAAPGRARPEDVESWAASIKRPPDDVQAAVTVLARLPERPGQRRADLRGAYLRRVIMTKGQMAFSEPLEWVVVTWRFDGYPNDAGTGNLARAAFANANLTGAFFTSSNLTDARFLDTDLTGAFLNHANLTRALFSRADLSEAGLEGADLTNADLTGALLTNTRVHGANLAAAKGLTQARLDSAWGDSTTKIPADLHLPDSWPRVDGADR